MTSRNYVILGLISLLFLNNIFYYDYFYNGSGVAIGDINNDGMPDIFFTGNKASNSLFLNKGNLVFQDITAESKVHHLEGWRSGVTMVDINQDGWLDVYVCRSYMRSEPFARKNLLYINNKDLTFTESAESYGLADEGFSVQAAFFDYDKDGDLDMYLANHTIDFRKSINRRSQIEPNQYISDKLYRNEGNNTFTDVSKAAGIWNYACGLGLSIGDMNQDGWPDGWKFRKIA